MALNRRPTLADVARVLLDPDADDLHEDLSAVARGDEHPDELEEEFPLVPHAVAAALAVGREERAWALTSLAVELTSLGHHDEALDVLRASVKLRASERVRVAALTCAVAIRCRQGEHDDALRIGELVLHSTGEIRLLRVIGRLLRERSEITGDLRLGSEALRYFERADLEEAFESA